MNDVSIFIWTLVIGIFDFFLWIALEYCNTEFDSFYEKVHSCVFVFLFNLACFIFVIYRAVLYTKYIWNAVTKEGSTGWQLLNGLFSWIPFLLTVSLFIRSVCVILSIFESNSSSNSERKTFCSLKTIKFIKTFSDISYDDSCFYYMSGDGKKIILYFSPLVYIFMCFYAYKNDMKYYEEAQKEEENSKEKVLYETLISDLQKIQKENEAEASKYFDKAKETFKNIK